MTPIESSFINNNGANIVYYKWLPEEGTKIKGILYIIHGLSEHSLRYDFMAKALNQDGFICYAQDYRGHGKTMELDKPGWFGNEGNNGVLSDLLLLIDKIKEEYPQLPLFIYGHSNGSFYSQYFIQKYGEQFKGAILSGSSGKQELLNISKLLIKIIIALKGLDTQAGFAYNLSIGKFDNAFRSDKTKNAWLSTIKEVVEQYNNDPLCGFRPPNQYFLEITYFLSELWKPKNEAQIPKELPIFIIRGEYDIVSKFGKNWDILIKRYKKRGLKITSKVYEKARHEPHNDISREEIIVDLISFLNQNLIS